MSSDSLALFRRNASTDLQKLADEHLEHDLTPSDCALLKSASTTISTHILIGTLVGLSIGSILSIRLRQSRRQWFTAFRTTPSSHPTSVKFADGREEAIPDITEMLKPTPLGDWATYMFFGLGGLFVGGEMGTLTGMMSARRKVFRDREVGERVERAWRGFRVDILRREIEALESGKKIEGGWMRA